MKIALCIIAIYFLPYFIMGESAHVLIHDNLDSSLAWIKIFLNNGSIYPAPSTNIDQVFNGIPSSAIYPLYDISLIFFKIFGLFWGYVLNKIIMSLVGFYGMYYLLKNHFLKDSTELILVGSALCFALLPFWSFNLTVSGLPMVLLAFLNIRSGQKLKTNPINWFILLVFAFYSALILSGIFILILMSLLFVYDWLKKKKFNLAFFLSMGFLSVFYLISHFPVVYSFVSADKFEPHRLEFFVEATNYKIALYNSFNIFKSGQYHALSLQSIFLIPVILMFVWGWINKKWNKTTLFLLIFIGLTSLLYGLQNFEAFQGIINKLKETLPIQIDRFHFLHPMFWGILFAITLLEFQKNWKLGKYLVYTFLLVQLAYVSLNHEILANRTYPNYEDFYSEELFSEVNEFIGLDPSEYRVISLGMHPAAAQYNGFYTLDGYFANYPLSYKKNWRKVIQKELEKNERLRKHFDHWGSRVYAFSSELKNGFYDNRPDPIQYLDLNYELLKTMNCQYIISSAEVNTINNPNLEWLHTFENTDEYWTIWLYAIK